MEEYVLSSWYFLTFSQGGMVDTPFGEMLPLVEFLVSSLSSLLSEETKPLLTLNNAEKTNRRGELHLNFSLITPHYPLLHSKIHNLDKRNVSFEFNNTMFHITGVKEGPLQHIYRRNTQVIEAEQDKTSQ